MKNTKIGFIGGGNMATSLIKGFLASGHDCQSVWVSDVDPEKLQGLSSQLGVNISSDNNQIISACDVVVLAVKPQILQSVAEAIAPALAATPALIVSIAAGINQSSLSKWLGNDIAIVRCMPNTPSLVLTGATALHANSNVNSQQSQIAENILRAVGLALWVSQEELLDAVTAVSGSGPAYFFLLMEAMQETAVNLGLDDETAALLVQQTALGAAKIALESEESAQQLRKRVTSPGGTTQSAIECFQNGGFEDLVNKALHAARNRSIEMSKQLGEQS